MASLKERLSARLSAVRERRPLVDHLVRMQQHYGAVKGNQQAGAVTYFGFLSFFPILALAFAAVGVLSQVLPDARDTTIEAIQQVFPGIIGTDEGQLSLDDVESAAGTAVGVGLVGLLYAGLGWLSSLRDGLLVVFEQASFERPGFVAGKLRDLATLVTVGVVLFLSVAVSTVASRLSGQLLDAAELGEELAPLLVVLTLVIGLGASTVLFLALFRLLADPRTPRRSLLSGAVLGAIGFELLKQLSSLLLTSAKGQPAFQAFGIALILLVWINYFSRVILYAAAWAHTSAAARAGRVREPDAVQGPQVPSLVDLPLLTASGPTAATGTGPAAVPGWQTPFAAGAAAMLALVAVVRRRPR